MAATGIVRDPRYLMHKSEGEHPETHRRLEGIYGMLDGPDMNGCFVEIAPRPAEREELLLVHSPEHLKRLAATEEVDYCSLTADTYACRNSYQASVLAAGGVLEAVRRVAAGELGNAFALVRPPGHHAERSRAMGFCLFNNAALGAMFARHALGLNRVLIVDWDVHHGNGTQHCFEHDPSVVFFSTHQNLKFPGTGLFTEVGRGRGEGATINLVLPKGCGDADFAALYTRILRPVALELAPDLILVSAGFDTHHADPIGGMGMTERGFAALTRLIMEIADQCCGGKVVFCLEGGYNLKALSDSVKAVLLELAGRTVCDVAALSQEIRRKKLHYALHRCLHVQRLYWKSLRE